MLRDGAVALHPKMRAMFDALAEAGVLAATRPASVGGQSLPSLVATAANAYLCAGNGSAAGLAMLTTEAAHLIESFGSDELRARYMHDLYAGRVTGTMALTEPHAGSSLGDITTKATPRADGTYNLTGSKIFISGGEHDLTENIVHMVLARIEGAPEGSRGVSLFCVPKLRPEGDAFVDNDVRCAGVLHKIGWRALPSVVLNFGEEGDCHGWLVGAPGRGLPQMFQMMNAARIGVGASAAAVAYAAYQEALRYARTRPQGRALTGRDAQGPQVAHHRAPRRAADAPAAEGHRRGGPLARARGGPLRRPRGARADDGERRRARRSSTSSPPWRRPFPRRRASKPTSSRCRSTAATATPRSTSPSSGCASRSSTASTRGRRAFRASTSSAARWSRAAARRSRRGPKR